MTLCEALEAVDEEEGDAGEQEEEDEDEGELGEALDDNEAVFVPVTLDGLDGGFFCGGDGEKEDRAKDGEGRGQVGLAFWVA